MATTSTLTLSGFSDAELLDLEAALGPDAIQRSEPDRQRYEAGALEPVTATIILSALAIQILGAWLLKTRKNQRIRSRVRVVHPDGRIEEKELDVDLSSEKSEKDVVRAIMKDLDLPMS